MIKAVFAVVMAGGSGTRFWPASRAGKPKQLLSLVGTESLLAQTVHRVAKRIPLENVLISTGKHLVDATAAAIPKLSPEQFLAEPVPRNTAPCVAWANAVALRRDKDAIVAVFPADHAIADEAAFLTAVDRAIDGASRGFITTIGIVPTRPDTGYGYIAMGAAIAPGLFAAKGFIEKPERARAEALVSGKKHLWNGGMFFFRASQMAEAFEKHLPDVGAGAARIAEDPAQLEKVFPTLQSISIDHGIMEKTDRVAVVPGDFGWSDIGSWQTAWELAQKDADQNALPGGSIAIDAKRNLVRDLRTSGGARTYAVLGVDDLIVVETDDCVLVLPRERAQDVRMIVDALKQSKRSDLL